MIDLQTQEYIIKLRQELVNIKTELISYKEKNELLKSEIYSINKSINHAFYDKNWKIIEELSIHLDYVKCRLNND